MIAAAVAVEEIQSWPNKVKKKDQFKHLHDQDVLYEFIGAALVWVFTS